ncbi:Rne/Rng family ribonuclease [Pacificimonas flava]|nr:ribonuclease E/G [Pacificimonas flava]MBB5280939.1 ribonuclease E [Pacificimonas flava]
MATRMLIDARHPEETRVAVVKGNRIEEFDFESAQRAQIKGNIYLAKVTRVEPSLQAAFVDYGGNRHGFLAFSEIHPDYYQIPKADRDALLAEERAAAQEHDEEVESRRTKRRRRDEDSETAEDEDHHDHDDEHDEHDHDDHDTGGDDHVDNASNEALRKKRQNLRRRYKIQEVIKRRQVLLVQVVKEERGNKGAALTTYLSLAGRYSVLMPNTSHGGGISRKIASAADRKRLKSIVSEMNLPAHMGVIVRTAGASRTKPEIKRDFDYLSRLWDEVRQLTLASSAPALIHEDSDLIKRAIRDLYSRDIEEVLVDGEEGYKAAKGFMKLLMPSHARKVQHYADPVPIYQRYRVEEQLSEMYHPTVRLKSGGYLVINPTEALVSIDINSGKSTREHNIEETAYKTNVEAAREIARQLKLRDMAGLIVIDFIDMDHGSNVRKVEKALKEALKDDRARIQVGRISQFGLMEMSRQRLRTGVLEASTSTCPVCDGAGIVRTVESAALGALREVEAMALKGQHNDFSLHLPAEVAVYLVNEKRRSLNNLEERYGIHVRICPEDEMHINEREIEARGGAPRPTVDISRPDGLQEQEPEEDIVDDYEDEEADERTARGEGREEDRDRDSDRGRGRRRRGGRNRRRRGGRDREEGTRDETAHDEDSREARGSSGDDQGREEPAERADREHGADADADDGRSSRRRRGRRGGRGRRRNEERQSSEQADAASEERPEAESDDRKVAEAQAEPAADLDIAAAADAPQAEEEVKEKPARKPRRRRKTASADEDASQAADTMAESADTGEAKADEAAGVEAAEAPAKKPARRRTRKAATSKAEEGDSSPAAPADDAPKPKPRARRKKKTEDAPAEAAADTPRVTDGAEAGAADQTAQTPEPAAANDPDGDTPKRKGWWQRTFGA